MKSCPTCCSNRMRSSVGECGSASRSPVRSYSPLHCCWNRSWLGVCEVRRNLLEEGTRAAWTENHCSGWSHCREYPRATMQVLAAGSRYPILVALGCWSDWTRCWSGTARRPLRYPCRVNELEGWEWDGGSGKSRMSRGCPHCSCERSWQSNVAASASQRATRCVLRSWRCSSVRAAAQMLVLVACSASMQSTRCCLVAGVSKEEAVSVIPSVGVGRWRNKDTSCTNSRTTRRRD